MFRRIGLGTAMLLALASSQAAAWPAAPLDIHAAPATAVARHAAHRRSGIASYYAHRLDGRMTASGDAYDENALTAAHRTLPFGTRLRVTNLMNARSIIVMVTDRGPFAAGRIIDLSWRAALELGFVARGTTRVKIERLAPEAGLERLPATARAEAQAAAPAGD